MRARNSAVPLGLSNQFCSSFIPQRPGILDCPRNDFRLPRKHKKEELRREGPVLPEMLW